MCDFERDAAGEEPSSPPAASRTPRSRCGHGHGWRFGGPGLGGTPLPHTERHRDCVKIINESGSLLLKHIDDLFDTAKIESGQIELREEAQDPAALAREAISFLQPSANSKQINLRLEIGPDLPVWLVDHRAALQILGNLLTNAVKFSGRGTSVVTRLASTPQGGLTISIADQGPGIRADMLPRIFDRFARGDPMVSGKEEGLGLGLWIVRNLVEMHRGDISVDSVVGSGTAVRLHFPPAFAPRMTLDPMAIPAD